MPRKLPKIKRRPLAQEEPAESALFRDQALGIRRLGTRLQRVDRSRRGAWTQPFEYARERTRCAEHHCGCEGLGTLLFTCLHL
jgi:hypothetical protein